ncbi:ThuA domain-containing protein [bacterium]|nr:ThuA domain-containing protein [bacterium]
MIRLLALALIGTLVAGGWAAEPAGGKILVFSKTAGFRHDSIPVGVEAIKRLAEAHGWQVEATEDGGAFTDGRLEGVSVVVFLNTTGDVLDATGEAAFERYLRRGGGYVGVHAANDTEYDWPWYGKLVGAYFKSHPAIQDASIVVLDRNHAATRAWPERFTHRDEWYNFRANPVGVRVLARVDETTYKGGTHDNDHPIAWCHEYDGGRAFYTGLGHTKECFADERFLLHLWGGMAWAAGRE